MSDNAGATRGKSFLIADCGHITTSVALFDAVAGRHRLIACAAAPTTTGTPLSDITIGIQQAVSRIEAITGRTLLTQSGDIISPVQPAGSGVDYFGATVSAAPPLRAVIAGLLEDVSVASARRALNSVYAAEVESVTLADTRDEETQINALLTQEPDVVILAGGTDDGDSKRLLRILDIVELSLGLREVGRRPQVIFAGTRALRERVTAELGSQTTVHVAANLRPTAETEQLGEVVTLVGSLYEELKLGELPGIGEVTSWSTYPPQPTARAFGQMIRYFGALYRDRVLGIDLGSDSVTVAAADNETLQLSVRSDLGMGQPIAELFTTQVAGEVASWLALDTSEGVLADFLHTKALHAGTVPMTEEELQIEQALARYLLREAVGSAAQNWGWSRNGAGIPSFSLLLLRGQALTQAPRGGQALLMALDALQPTGVFAVALDQYGVLPALGLLAQREPLAAVQILEGGVLLDLGWVVAPRGRVGTGQTLLRVKVDAERQGQLNVDVVGGDLMLLPLAPGEQAELVLEPARRVDVGFGRGQGKKITIHGGTVGLVIDARGRPLELPKDQEKRQALLQRWRWDMGG
jgi:hypothetical protein